MKKNETHHLKSIVKLGVAVAALLSLGVPVSTKAHDGPPVRVQHGMPIRITSSVQVSGDVVARAAKAGREAYSSTLAPYAKFPVDQARATALAKYPGTTCQDIGLQSLHHNLVYIAFLTKDESRHLVIIDAGNGNILATRDMAVHRYHVHREIW